MAVNSSKWRLPRYPCRSDRVWLNASRESCAESVRCGGASPLPLPYELVLHICELLFLHIMGFLIGGFPICCVSTFLKMAMSPVAATFLLIKKVSMPYVPCRIKELPYVMSPIFSSCQWDSCHMSILRKGHVTL